MSLTASPHGCLPTSRLGSQYNTQGFSHIPIASAYDTNIFAGDLVSLVAAGVVEKETGTTNIFPVGVFLGCTYTDPSLNYKLHSQFWPADTVASDAVAYVDDDPDSLFRMQASGAVSQASIGANANIVQTAGSTSIHRSRNALNVTGIAVTATLVFRIVDFYRGPNSTPGDAFTDLIVRLNQHRHRTATGI